MINKWHQTFLEIEFCEAARSIRAPTVDHVGVINSYVENQRQSLRRGPDFLAVYVSAIKSVLKKYQNKILTF